MLCASKNPPKYPEPIVLKMLLTQAKSTKRKQTKKKWKEGKKILKLVRLLGFSATLFRPISLQTIFGNSIFPAEKRRLLKNTFTL